MISKIPKECPIIKKKSVIEYQKSRHHYVVSSIWVALLNKILFTTEYVWLFFCVSPSAARRRSSRPCGAHKVKPQKKPLLLPQPIGCLRCNFQSRLWSKSMRLHPVITAKQNKEEQNLTLYSKIIFLSIQGIVLASFWSNKAYTLCCFRNDLTFPRNFNFMLRWPSCRRLLRAYQRDYAVVQ